MQKSFKTEIFPTDKQRIQIHKTIGTCRYLYNFYIATNKERHEKGEAFMTARNFSIWLNNEYLPTHPEYHWIKEVSSKSIKKSLENANQAFLRFFEHQSGFPVFKKKNKSDVKMYFVKNNKMDCLCERHRVKIPTLGWVRIKEKGYLPLTSRGLVIKSGSVSMKAGRYYVSVLIEVPDVNVPKATNAPLGIDLGLKDFAILSNGKVYKNINKKEKIKKLEKQLKREQRCLSRKYESLKKRSKKMLGKEKATRQNINKQVLKVQKLHQRMNFIRTDYVNKTISEIVKTKPSHITIEDLNVSGMMKNCHLSKAIASQKFSEFRIKLTVKCHEYGIELRIVNRFYPSSKTCHCCGRIKKDLKLSDRIYRCECGYVADRDLNAALNLRDAKTYRIA